MAPSTLTIHIDCRYTGQVARFVKAIQEIAGTTNDPNTATNLHAAIDALYGRTAKVEREHPSDPKAG